MTTLWARLAAVALVAGLSGCSSTAPSSPSGGADGGAMGGDAGNTTGAADGGTEGGDGGGNAPMDAGVTAMTIGAGGGTLETADGVVILIPAGALPASTAITVTRILSPAMGAVGPLYELGPDGTRFAQPVTLTLPYDEATLGGTSPGDLMLAQRMNGAWSGAGFAVVDTGSRRVTGYITHFSTWAIVPSPRGARCEFDYGCFSSCCGTQAPDLCCNANRNTCHCASGRTFAGFVTCYADCLRTPQANNFASSPCLSACCRAEAGTSNHGACMIADRRAAEGVLSCARSCTGPGDQMVLCQRGDLTFDACSWDARTRPVIGSDCPVPGVDSQFLYSNFRTILSQTWGNPPAVRVDSGAFDASTLSAQVSCVGGAGSGTIRASWNGSLFDGTWTFGTRTGTITIAPNWRQTP